MSEFLIAIERQAFEHVVDRFEHGDARQDRERLIRGAEVVLARRDRPLVEPEEEARELEFEVLREGDPGSDRFIAAATR